MQPVFIVISIAVLVVAVIIVFFLGKNRQKNRLTPLAGIAFAFVVAGIVFGENRWISYSLMGVGVAMAIVDIITRSRRA